MTKCHNIIIDMNIKTTKEETIITLILLALFVCYINIKSKYTQPARPTKVYSLPPVQETVANVSFPIG